jgi:hypothetical protein
MGIFLEPLAAGQRTWAFLTAAWAAFQIVPIMAAANFM